MDHIMKAKFVRKLSENTSLYCCDPPMRFLKPSVDPSRKSEVVESALVVAWTGEVADGLHRAVLHNAHLLAGGDGLGYGADGCRMFDAKLNQREALNLAGYDVEWGDGSRRYSHPMPSRLLEADMTIESQLKGGWLALTQSRTKS